MCSHFIIVNDKTDKYLYIFYAYMMCLNFYWYFQAILFICELFQIFAYLQNFSSTFGENKHVSKPLQLKPLCSRANCISYETSQGWVAGLRIWIILHFGPHDISSHPYKQSQGANIFQVFILQPLTFTILYNSRHSIFTEMSCSS